MIRLESSPDTVHSSPKYRHMPFPTRVTEFFSSRNPRLKYSQSPFVIPIRTTQSLIGGDAFSPTGQCQADFPGRQPLLWALTRRAPPVQYTQGSSPAHERGLEVTWWKSTCTCTRTRAYPIVVNCHSSPGSLPGYVCLSNSLFSPSVSSS